VSTSTTSLCTNYNKTYYETVFYLNMLGLPTTYKIPTLTTTPGVCKNVRDLTSSNGAYIKTACTVYQFANQNNARFSCLANGMQLYNFNTEEAKTSLLDYADTQWPFARLWVEGTNGTKCSTVSNNNLTNFEMVYDACSSGYYFYCEYRGNN
jgi:hypothetical protein